MTTDRITSISDAIAEAIRAGRKREGLTRAEFATAAWDAGAPTDFSAAVVGYIETGRRDKDGRRKREVTVDEAVFLAAALGTTVLELLGEHAHLYGTEEKERCSACESRGGAVLAQARLDIEDLGDLADVEPTLAQLIYALASAVDAGGDKLPSLAKELRETLKLLIGARAVEPPAEEDDLDDAGEPD